MIQAYLDTWGIVRIRPLWEANELGKTAEDKERFFTWLIFTLFRVKDINLGLVWTVYDAPAGAVDVITANQLLTPHSSHALLHLATIDGHEAVPTLGPTMSVRARVCGPGGFVRAVVGRQEIDTLARTLNEELRRYYGI